VPRRLRDLADEELIGLVERGDMAAFEVIFDRHAGVAYAFAQYLCRQHRRGQRASAEDIVHEAFLSLWRQPERHDRDGRARGAGTSLRSRLLQDVHKRAQADARRLKRVDRRPITGELPTARFGVRDV
jgi:DNA-directed RNA polymerase specialized sigma24 family protein